jgi:hypothetical protein
MSSHKINNDNGVRVVNFATSKNVVVKSTHQSLTTRGARSLFVSAKCSGNPSESFRLILLETGVDAPAALQSLCFSSVLAPGALLPALAAHSFVLAGNGHLWASSVTC